jgi:tRNA-dihydrouridine synthase B
MKVPLIISGDIFSPEKAIEALNITKADAVMVARGIIGCPNLINDIYNSIEKNEIVKSPKVFKTQKEQCLALAKYLIEEKGESRAMRVYRSIAPKFFGGFPEVKKLNAKLAGDLVSFKQLQQILDDYESTLDMN